MDLLIAVERVRSHIPLNHPITVAEIAAAGLIAPDLVVDALFLLLVEGTIQARSISRGQSGHEILFWHVIQPV